MTLGERIAYYRGKLGLSQGELAEQLGVSRQAVSKWETDAGLPDLERLIALSRLYHITLDELVKGESPEETAEAPEEIPVDAVIAKPAAPSGQKTIGYILLGVGLLCAVLALVRVFKPIPAAKLAIFAAAVSFTLLCCVNVKQRVIDVNLARYEAGIDEELDWGVLWECGYREEP